MSLQEALLAVLSGGGGWLTYLLMEHIPFLKEIKRADYKRYASLAISALLPVLAWLALLGMGYEGAPATWQGWVERIFALMAPALIVGQGIHGAKKLAPRKDNPQGT